MPRASRRRLVTASVWAALAVAGAPPSLVSNPVRAEASAGTEQGPAPPAAQAVARHPFPSSKEAAVNRRGSTGSSGAWWMGTAGAAFLLAAIGGVSLASRRFPARSDSELGALKVIGKTSLSPRHSVYLLKAGDRVLIVGAGGQGPPSLLGELTPPAAPGVDRTIGEDE